jgi:hypothetical protein
MTSQLSSRPEPSSTPVFRNILKYGTLLAAVIAVVGGALGFLFVGVDGLVSALIGAAMAVLFLGVTAASILFANRVSGADMLNPAYFAIVMGAWFLKFLVFLILVFVLKDQAWIDGTVLFLTLVAAVLGTLVVDLVVIARSRIPYVSDVTLPGDTERR